MKVDILSDLHLDFYYRSNIITTKDVTTLFAPILTQNNSRELGDVLIVAGDIGHYNEQNIEVLIILQKKYYNNIICVLGNHDYYLSNMIQEDEYEMNSFNRAKEMRNLINSREGLHCLDGNVVEINGVKFGGCDGWYNNSYLKAYYPLSSFSQKSMNQMWANCMHSDFKFIKGISNYNDIFQIEQPKIEAVYKNCDIMITHINPSYLNSNNGKKLKQQQSNTFFCFNGHNYLEKGNMKYWIFGHTHREINYNMYDVDCICNPMGYPSETNTIKIKSIEVK